MKKLLILFCCFALLLPAARAAGPTVEAGACLLMEKETGQILHAQEEHRQLEPTSVTKSGRAISCSSPGRSTIS